MLNYFDVIQKSKAFNIIKCDNANNKLSHAYLFVCSDNNYLKAFSENVCKLLINNEKYIVEKNNIRIEKRIHPDVKFYGEDKALDAKIISEILEQTDYSPFEADKKIFVLNNVQDMNEISQNKILKTIEEPPKNTYFILTATNTSRILTTIKSRVKEIKLDEISKSDIVKMLMEVNITKENAEIYANCCASDASIAENFATDLGFIEFFNNVVSMLIMLDGSKDVLKWSALFNDKKFDKNELFNILIMLIRDALMISTNKSDLIINNNKIKELTLLSIKLNINSLLELIDKCNQCKEMIAFNVNSTAVVDDFLYKLAEVKVRCRKL